MYRNAVVPRILALGETRNELKSLKSNAGLARSPTRRIMTQKNHIFTAICAVFKLECLKMKHKINHFALRAKLLIKATQTAYFQLQKLQSA